jgi:hypothetical protein
MPGTFVAEAPAAWFPAKLPSHVDSLGERQLRSALGHVFVESLRRALEHA